MTLSRAERASLTAIAAFGMLGPNAVFVYYGLARRAEFMAAMRHPVTLSLLVDAMIAMALLAWAIARSGRFRHGWQSFVGLSLLGGLVFSIPVFLLTNAERERPN
ncbi:MAG: hypothetical protein ACR2HE_08110 [Casimicrobiaceae bacterium]